MSGFAQEENESTSEWLKRLIRLNAPTDVCGDVRAILVAETRQAQAPTAPPAGKLELLVKTNEISKFWNAICCGNVECNDSILSFADGLSWMINENIPMIYERNVYKEIFEELCAGKLEKMLVFGTPGIGKSLLEFYLLYRFAKHWKDGKTHSILYKTRDESNPKRFLFETDGTQHRVYLVKENAEIRPDYYFTDTYSDVNYHPIKTIVHVTSPSEKKAYDQFAKSVGVLAMRNRGTFKCMLPFTWEEAKFLLVILNLLNIKDRLPEISEEEFQFMFWVFGGSARLLSTLCNLDVNKEISDFVDREMTDFFDGVTTNVNRRHPGLKAAFPLTWKNACNLITYQLEYTDRSNLSSDVVKQSMFLHKYHDQGDSRKEVWASTFMKYLAAAIMDDHNNIVFNELRNLFNNSNAAIGAIFERCAIKDILANLKDGQSYTCDKLKKTKTDKSESWEFKTKFTRKVIINKIEDIANMKCGEFGVSNIVNFALVDLVYKGDMGELILFNMYYGDGKKHKGAVDRLKDIQRANQGPKVNDKMIFVLKPENKAFAYQTDLANINQFRMDFNLSRMGNKHRLDDNVEEVVDDLITGSASPRPKKRRKADKTNSINAKSASKR